MKEVQIVFVTVLLFLSVIISCFSQSVEGEQRIDLQKLKTVADSLGKAQVAAGSTVGLSIAIGLDGDMIYKGGFGKSNLPMNIKATAEIVYNIASISKQFTAAAVLKLAEQGKISLDDPIHKFFPDYPEHAKEVKVHHLLSHTSGIKNYSELGEELHRLSESGISQKEVIRLFAEEPLYFQPGSSFRYSNSGYYLLGLIIEKVSGLTYAQYMEEELLKPLGLFNTYYCESESIIPNGAEGYSYRDNGTLIKSGPISFEGAAGSLCSTVGDLILWNESLYGGKVVSEESLQKMIAPVVFKDGSSRSYGYGLDLATIHNRAVILHSGELGGFRSYLSYYPEEGLSIAVLGNSVRAKPGHVEEIIAKTAFGIEVKQIKDHPVTAEEVQRFSGIYEFLMGKKPHRVTIFEKDGTLFMNLSGGDVVRLKSQGSGEFIPLTDETVLLKFATDNRDTAKVGLELNLGGKLFQGKKIEAPASPQ